MKIRMKNKQLKEEIYVSPNGKIYDSNGAVKFLKRYRSKFDISQTQEVLLHLGWRYLNTEMWWAIIDTQQITVTDIQYEVIKSWCFKYGQSFPIEILILV